jgi:hypothetical protein
MFRLKNPSYLSSLVLNFSLLFPCSLVLNFSPLFPCSLERWYHEMHRCLSVVAVDKFSSLLLCLPQGLWFGGHARAAADERGRAHRHEQLYGRVCGILHGALAMNKS